MIYKSKISQAWSLGDIKKYELVKSDEALQLEKENFVSQKRLAELKENLAFAEADGDCEAIKKLADELAIFRNFGFERPEFQR